MNNHLVVFEWILETAIKKAAIDLFHKGISRAETVSALKNVTKRILKEIEDSTND